MTDIATSVLARLKNKAAGSGRSYQLCLQLFCQEEFLRRLEKSEYAENRKVESKLTFREQENGSLTFSLVQCIRRLNIAVLFFKASGHILASPVAHGMDNVCKSFSSLCKGIFGFGRNHRVDFPMDYSVMF